MTTTMVIISELLKRCYCPSDRGTHQTMTNDISMSIGPCVNYLELAGEYIYNLNVPISHFLNVSIFKPRHLVTVVFNCEADKYKKKTRCIFYLHNYYQLPALISQPIDNLCVSYYVHYEVY